MTSTASKLFTPGNIGKIITIPDIAWPTVALFLVALGTHVTTINLLHAGVISNALACAINTVAIFAVFTPMHDASHGSVAKHQYAYINTVIGHLAGCCFPLPYGAFKYLHYQHHKHTNEEGLDPDLFVHAGMGLPAVLFPLKFFCLEFFYYYMYLSKLSTRPVREALPALTFLVSLVGVVGWTRYHAGDDVSSANLWRTMLWGWLVPGRIALALLAVFFDYLPHAPFVVRKQDAFKSTCVLTLFAPPSPSAQAKKMSDKVDPSAWSWMLTWPLLQQNYHNIHHHAPYVPFYLYSPLWNAWKWELLEAGTEVHSLLS